MLWHKRLGHISIERIKRLEKDGILQSLDFSDLDSCVDCIKESRNAKFLENDTFSGSDQFHDLVNENDHEVIPTTSGQGETIVLIDSHPIEVIKEHNVVSLIPSDHVERNSDILEEAPHNAQEEPQEEFHIEQHQPPQEVELRRSQRAKKPAISNDYMVYLLESDYDVNIEDDPVTFSQAMNCSNSKLWELGRLNSGMNVWFEKGT
ncbi:Retrovirus-related Pol polyprotein from transposon TNT 1-94 [Senna tora]|uniref:Retrovirus-related Pol polyprotein from transposon TNT 1-94 n=1 Tax=Senna tora TaxID=362788 RepID=A0A834W8N1_9FABA|nr:Retrovirus-related Pol polyprotein from transposon TNT 1-94 [Senna tora]